MNESQSPKDVSPASSAAAATKKSLQKPLIIALVVLALLQVAQWWNTHTQIRNLREEMARRLQTGDVTNSETKVIAKTMQETMKELQAKVNVLESKQLESQSHQLAVEQMYQDLSKNRDDWSLSEIEQVLSTASQQLQLAGNVQGALIALQNADSRLSRADKPQFITIRRAIGKDIDKLKALPSVDLTGITLRLDNAINQIDTLPLLSDEKPIVALPPAKNAVHAVAKGVSNVSNRAEAEKGSAVKDALAGLDQKWQNLSTEVWGEVSQLIRVRSTETPDALLVSPTQAFYLRENLKLRLLNARLALLSRSESTFRSDMLVAQNVITKYFDTRAKSTQLVQMQLKQVQASNLSIDLPTLADSLNAVRNYKAKP